MEPSSKPKKEQPSVPLIPENARVYGKVSDGVKFFPLPISCLKIHDTGRPFVYHRYDKEAGKFVEEEIKTGKMMHVSGEDGRVKMRLALPSVEETDAEGKEEENKQELPDENAEEPKKNP